MLLVALLLAPSVMVAASFAERRLGPGAAGWLNAAPLSIAVAVLVVSSDRGVAAGLTVATTAAAHVPAQVAFAVTFATVLRTRRSAIAARGLLAGAAAFVAFALAVAAVPPAAAIIAAAPALLAGSRLLPPASGDTGPAGGGGGVAVRAAVALGVVAAVLAAVRFAGPELGGTVAAFPALSACLAVLITRDRGPLAAAHALRGVVHGLAGYLAFCLTLALTAPLIGLPTALALGFTACLVAFGLTWHAVRLPTRVAIA